MRRLLPIAGAFLIGMLLVLVAMPVGLVPYALLVIAATATLLLGRDVLDPTRPGFGAAVRVVTVLTFLAVAFGEVYFLLPADSISPPFPRTPAGVVAAIHFSVLTMVTLGGGDHQAVSTTAKAVQLLQIFLSFIFLGFGLNYLREQGREEGGGNGAPG
jgi:hypothetical protein